MKKKKNLLKRGMEKERTKKKKIVVCFWIHRFLRYLATLKTDELTFLNLYYFANKELII